MSLFSFFSAKPERTQRAPRKKKNSLRFEALEDRYVPHAGHDAAGGAAAAVAAQAEAAALTKTVNFATTPTDFTLQGVLDKFDPNLGTLQSIEITHAGSVTSQIQVENTSTESTSSISGTVSGNLTLQGPGGLDNKLNLSQYAGSASAGKYDGSIDFQGASGASFGIKTASGSDKITLSGNQLTGYIGSGSVTLTEAAQATSNAAGGGNLVAQISSTGQATVTVVYNYLKQAGAISGFVYHDRNNDGAFQTTEAPIDGVTITLTGTTTTGSAVNQTATSDASGAYQFIGLSPGTYTVTETQPATWVDGRTTAGSMGGNATRNVIAQIALPTNGQSINNNFGELRGSSLAGNVYYDTNSNGQLDPSDPAIPGTVVSLTGIDMNGAVTRSTITDAAGHYEFDNLMPGSYSVVETQPAGYAQGSNTLGALGGTLAGDQISNIQLPDATDVTNYNFGEVRPASLSGFVFVDPNNNCVKDAGEVGIPGVTIFLTGIDLAGNQVSLSTTTDPTGRFSFSNLAPGTYRLVESHPSAYQQGQTCAGSLGGVATTDVISNIVVPMGAAGVDYHFGEIQPPPPPPPKTDVAIVKTASSAVSGWGDQLVYNLRIMNLSTTEARDVVVIDNFPGAVQVLHISAPFWDVALLGNRLTLYRSSMSGGTTNDVQVTVRVPSHNDTLTNQVQVTTTTPDINPLNNTHQVTTIVQGTPPPPPPPPQVADIPIVPLQTRALVEPVLIGKGQLFTDTAAAAADPAVRGLASFVDGVYQTLTGESADRGTVHNAVSQLQNGLSRQEFVYRIWNGDTHLKRSVSSVYQTVLSRTPTASELAAGVQMIRGNPTSGLMTQLLNSAEFQARNAGSAAMSARMAQIFLGTTSDAALAQTLDSQPVGAAVQSTMYSSAALRRLVETTYRSTLRRAATAGELEYWSYQLASGAISADGMASTLLASTEFYQLAYNSAR